MKPTREQIAAYIELVKAITETIRLGSAETTSGAVPLGPIYAVLMGKFPWIDLPRFNAILGSLERAGVIRRAGKPAALFWARSNP